MVTKQANIYVYDNFKVGIAEPAAQPPAAERFIHISFTEQDFPNNPELNSNHVFRIHEKQIDAFIEMLRAAQGKKAIHLAIPGEMPNGARN